MTNTKPWSSLLEGDEQPDRANSQTCMKCCHECAAVYFWFVIHATAYHFVSFY